jgi:aspartate kinase
MARVRERANDVLAPVLEAGTLPVVGGFVGSTPDGETTTLGRGGSDISAAVLGSAMEAEEIQVWTDVDGLMSADPRLVPAARTLDRVSFAEAAELAFYGARVLHPASVAPAVLRRIPLRVLNSLRPRGAGTVVHGEESDPETPPLVSVASRDGVSSIRVRSRRMRMDPAFLPAVLSAMERLELAPDMVVSSEVAVSLAVPGSIDRERLERELGEEVRVEVEPRRALVCVVGSGLARSADCRAGVLAALAEWEPELVALGASRISVAAVVRQGKLSDAVRALHRRFFEVETPV